MPRRNKRAQEYIPPLDLAWMHDLTWQLLDQAQAAADAQRAATDPFVNEPSTKEAHLVELDGTPCETRTARFTGQLVCTKCGSDCDHYICTHEGGS